MLGDLFAFVHALLRVFLFRFGKWIRLAKPRTSFERRTTIGCWLYLALNHVSIILGVATCQMCCLTTTATMLELHRASVVSLGVHGFDNQLIHFQCDTAKCAFQYRGGKDNFINLHFAYNFSRLMLQPWTATRTSTINWQSFFPPNDVFGTVLVHDPALLQNERRYQDQPKMQVKRTQKSSQIRRTPKHPPKTIQHWMFVAWKIGWPRIFFWATCVGTYSYWIPPNSSKAQGEEIFCTALSGIHLLHCPQLLHDAQYACGYPGRGNGQQVFILGVLRCFEIFCECNLRDAVEVRSPTCFIEWPVSWGWKPWNPISLCNILGSGRSDNFEVRSWLWLCLF